jgi:hypothetical protein
MENQNMTPEQAKKLIDDEIQERINRCSSRISEILKIKRRGKTKYDYGTQLLPFELYYRVRSGSMHIDFILSVVYT